MKVETRPEQDRIAQFLERALEPEPDIELVDYTVSKARNPLLRVFLYRPEGITVKDCARINRRLSRELEADESLAGRYAVEVSSPGLDRKLRTRRDFERAIGERLRIRILDEGRECEVSGLLTGVEGDHLLLESSPQGRHEGGGGPFRVLLEHIVQGSIEIVL